MHPLYVHAAVHGLSFYAERSNDWIQPLCYVWDGAPSRTKSIVTEEWLQLIERVAIVALQFAATASTPL